MQMKQFELMQASGFNPMMMGGGMGGMGGGYGGIGGGNPGMFGPPI
jgi:hypothetical protein